MITPYTLFEAVWIVGGLYVDSKLLWMVIYQIRYGGNAGELYLKGEKEKVKNDYNQRRNSKSNSERNEND